MRYLSTRGEAPEIGFRDAVLSGLAPDGGLYMPAFWPQFSRDDLTKFGERPFADVAAAILARFADGEISEADLRRLATDAYAPFDAPDVAPLVRLDGSTSLLELFHGPTLAFKDVAMRMLAALYGWALESGGGKTIIGATSGDTGGAAINAFAGSAAAEVFMLHPKGRVSDVQRRMMTTVLADSIVNIAIEGSFDDCQRIIKTLFADRELNAALDLGGVNSINWVRLAVQTVYYFTALAALGREASFVVPTGNFGDVFAGYAAKRMGAPVHRLGVAVNVNDIMRRALETGVYAPAQTTSTSSPSMDIQVASNFERLLFETSNRDGAAIKSLMCDFDQNGRFDIPPGWRGRMSGEFCAARAEEGEVAEKISEFEKRRATLIDPHTAVGLVAADKLRAAGALSGEVICLATAHPAKFPDAVFAACGKTPALPPRYKDLFALPERMETARADATAVKAVILGRSRFTGAPRR